MIYDLAINNGIIIDGFSKKRFKGSIGINKSKIIEISNSPLEGRQIINADNLIVAPGFIDIHTHSETGFVLDNRMENKLLQGVTTDIVGNCGISLFPKPKNRKYISDFKDYCSGLLVGMDMLSDEFDNTQEYLDFLLKNKIGINCGVLIGHGSLRICSMGFENREPSKYELNHMMKLLERELEMGALGMSVGLIYPPGSYSNQFELIELSRVLEKYNAILTAHIRNEGSKVFDSVQEIINVSEITGVRAHISHLKLLGPSQWGNAEKLVNMIEDAQKRGINITADQYPYSATSTMLSAVIPQIIQEGGMDIMLERLEESKFETDMLSEIKMLINERGGAERIVIAYTHEMKPEYEGQSLYELGRKLGITPEETVIKILKECHGKVNAVYHSILNKDMNYILGKRDIAIASDGFAFDFENKIGGGRPHPRSFGTFPRFLRLCRENEILPLELAIQKITSIPAKVMKLKNIGEIRVNNYADITILSENEFSDKATFANPFQRPVGLKYVIVSGKIAVKDGEITSQRMGRVLANYIS